MARSAKCRCGAELKAPDGHKTVRGVCPSCGETVVILPSGEVSDVQNVPESSPAIDSSPSPSPSHTPNVSAEKQPLTYIPYSQMTDRTSIHAKYPLFWTDLASGLLYLTGMLMLIGGSLVAIMAVTFIVMEPLQGPQSVFITGMALGCVVNSVFVLSISEILAAVAKRLS